MDQNILVFRQTDQFWNLQSNFWKALNTLMTNCLFIKQSNSDHWKAAEDYKICKLKQVEYEKPNVK